MENKNILIVVGIVLVLLVVNLDSFKLTPFAIVTPDSTSNVGWCNFPSDPSRFHGAEFDGDITTKTCSCSGYGPSTSTWSYSNISMNDEITFNFWTSRYGINGDIIISCSGETLFEGNATSTGIIERTITIPPSCINQGNLELTISAFLACTAEAELDVIEMVCVESDTNCDGTVDRTELGVSIDGWIVGTITRDNLGEAIVEWAG